MSGLFSKPKAPKPPPVPPPPSVPEVTDEASDLAMKATRRRKGFQSTILTGELAPTQTGKRTLLG